MLGLESSPPLQRDHTFGTSGRSLLFQSLLSTQRSYIATHPDPRRVYTLSYERRVAKKKGSEIYRGMPTKLAWAFPPGPPGCSQARSPGPRSSALPARRCAPHSKDRSLRSLRKPFGQERHGGRA